VALEVSNLLLRGESPALIALVFVKADLRSRMRGQDQANYREGCSDYCFHGGSI